MTKGEGVKNFKKLMTSFMNGPLPIFPALPCRYKTVGDDDVNASVACLTKNR